MTATTIDLQSRQYMNMLKAGNRLNLEKNDEEIQTMSKTLRQKLSSLLSE